MVRRAVTEFFFFANKDLIMDIIEIRTYTVVGRRLIWLKAYLKSLIQTIRLTCVVHPILLLNECRSVV